MTFVPNVRPGKFRVGDRVRMLHHPSKVIGEIAEDRGPIGVGGRRLYGVKYRVDEYNEHNTEVPEADLEAVDP